MRTLLPLVLVYGIQILVVVAVAALAELALRKTRPAVRLAYWRSVGLLCLVLPLAVLLPAGSLATGARFGMVGSTSIGQLGDAVGGSAALGVIVVVWLLAAVVVARLVWLGLGLLRLRLMRRLSVAAVMDARIEADRVDLAPRAELRWSHQVTQPVTFGLVAPVVLLPRSLGSLSPDARHAVVCHELLHVARHDWPWILAEELVRAMFWYHPAVWWLLARLDLSREQVVDELVVRRTASRKSYMDALVGFADRAFAVAPSIAFLRKRHLQARLRQINQEVTMTARHLASALTALAVLMGSVSTITVLALPLDQADSPTQDREVVRSDADGVTEPKLVRQVKPYYTPAAMDAKIQGVVVLDAVVEADGTVGDVTVARSLDAEYGLDEESIKAARQWRFEPGERDGKPVAVLVTVELTFTLR